MFVTMMPVTPGKSKFFGSLLTPLVADIISRSIDKQLGFVLNCANYLGDHKHLMAFPNYVSNLQSLGIQQPVHIVHDLDEVYSNFVSQVLIELSSQLSVSQDTVCSCDCGAVEILDCCFVKTVTEDRGRLFYKRDADIYCQRCNGLVIPVNCQVLRLDLKPPGQLEIWPNYLSSQINVLVSENVNRGLVISRKHRLGQLVKFNGNSFILDTDFRWSLFLNYLARNLQQSEVVLVSGSNTLPQAAKVLVMAKQLDPDLKVNLVIHPLIEYSGNDVLPSLTSIDDYLSLTGSQLTAKAFLALAMQWSRPISHLVGKDFLLVQESLKHLSEKNFNFDFSNQFNGLFSRLKFLNHTHLNEAMKMLRSPKINQSNLWFKALGV